MSVSVGVIGAGQEVGHREDGDKVGDEEDGVEDFLDLRGLEGLVGRTEQVDDGEILEEVEHHVGEEADGDAGEEVSGDGVDDADEEDADGDDAVSDKKLFGSDDN